MGNNASMSEAPTVDAPRRRGRPARDDRPVEETRDAILTAALQAFARQGFDGVSLREIASAAGVEHSLVRYHYADKSGLWRAAMTHLVGLMDAHMLEAWAVARTQEPLTRFRTMLAAYVRYCARHPEHAQITARFGDLPPQFVHRPGRDDGQFLPAAIGQHPVTFGKVGVPGLQHLTDGAAHHHLINRHRRRIRFGITHATAHIWVQRQKGLAYQQVTVSQRGNRRLFQPEVVCLRRADRARCQHDAAILQRCLVHGISCLVDQSSSFWAKKSRR